MSDEGRLPSRATLFVGYSVCAVMGVIAVALAIRWALEVPPPVPQLSDVGDLSSSWEALAPTAGRLLALFFGFSLGAAVSVVPHELGHAAAAWSMRVPVVGVAIGRVTFGDTAPLAATDGHVRVDLARAPQRWLPARMVVFALGGPMTGLAFAGLLALAAAAPDLPWTVRIAVGGAVAAGVYVHAFNLVPGRTRTGQRTDGALAIEWAFHSRRQRERLQSSHDLRARLSEPDPGTSHPGDPEERFEHLRQAFGDPRPPVAHAAARRMLDWLIASAQVVGQDAVVTREEFARRVRGIAPDVERFASRDDQPVRLRSLIAMTVAHVLISLYLRDLGGSPTQPASPEMVQLVRLAEQGWLLQPDKQVTRNTLALARLLQDRPSDTRALLLDVVDEGGAEGEHVRSDADALRGLAECELGDLAQAQRLLASARRRAVTSTYAEWLDAAIRTRAGAPRQPERVHGS